MPIGIMKKEIDKMQYQNIIYQTAIKNIQLPNGIMEDL
jgi:hypothetical protein